MTRAAISVFGADFDRLGVAFGLQRLGTEHRLHELRVVLRQSLNLRARDQLGEVSSFRFSAFATGFSDSACSYTRFWNWSAASANFRVAFCFSNSCSICALTSSKVCTFFGLIAVSRITCQPKSVRIGPTMSPCLAENTASSNGLTIEPSGRRTRGLRPAPQSRDPANSFSRARQIAPDSCAPVPRYPRPSSSPRPCRRRSRRA